MLPINNYDGVLWLLLALILFIAEVFTPAFGLLALGGIICMILGAMMFVNFPFPALQISWSLFLPITVAMGAVAFFLGLLVLRTHRQKITSGREGLIGSVGIAETEIAGKGKVFIQGELWEAVSDTPISAGKEVRIKKVEGLKLLVEPK